MNQLKRRGGGYIMMRRYTHSILMVLCIIALWAGQCHGDLVVTSSLSVDEHYDTNIYLSSDHETSDFITDLALSLGMADEGPTRTLSSHYTVSMVNFHRHSSGNYVGHSFDLGLDQRLSRTFGFHVTDVFYMSEEPLEEDPEITAVRRTRNRYYRNTAEAGFYYQFGEEDVLDMSYRDMRLRNEGEDVEDSDEYGPSVSLTYWITHRHGIVLSYSLLRTEYEYTPPHNTSTWGAGYRFRWSAHTTLTADYSFEIFQDQESAPTDYKVHDLSVGFEHSLGPEWSVGGTIGYYLRDPEVGSDDTGYSYTLSLSKAFRRGTVGITGSGGYREEYTDAERRGFTEYKAVALTGSYALSERIELHSGITYDYEEAEETDEMWSASLGASYLIRPWLTCSVDLTHRERTSSVEEDEYRDSIIYFRLTAVHEWR